MLPPISTSEMTSTPKKIFRSSQIKTTIEQANGTEQIVDDDRDEVASNTSGAVSQTNERDRERQKNTNNIVEFVSFFF